MTRVAAVCVLSLAGCVHTEVVASEISATSSADTGSDGAATQGATDDTGETGATPQTCDAPVPTAGCDEDADPLRAPEITCHPGIEAATFQTADGNAWRSAHEFGNAFWVGEDSHAVLVLSTGTLPLADPAGQVAVDPGAAQLASVANANPDDGVLPDPIVIAPGSNGGAGGTPYFDCDGIGDCSETLPTALAGVTAQDLIWLRFEVDVPADVHGYAVRVALLTAEYPERLGQAAADTFIWWSRGDTFTGNLATLAGQPATPSGLATRLSLHTLDDPMLLRTGFDGGTGQPCSVGGTDVPDCPIGASTGWLTLRGPAEPGEHLTITAALFDAGDALLDTVVVLDDWHWECAGCRPGETCGLSVP